MSQNQLICLILFYSVQFLRDKIAERDFRELSIIFEITSTSSRLNPFIFLEVFPRNSLRSEKSETTKLFHLISDHFVSRHTHNSSFTRYCAKKNYAMLKLFIIPRQVALRHFSFPNSVFCCCYLLQSPFLDIFCGKRTGAVQPVSPRIKYSPPSLFTLPPHPLLGSLSSSSSILYFLSSSLLPPTFLLPALSCRLLLFTSPQSCIPVLLYSFCSYLPRLPLSFSPVFPLLLMSPTPAFHF